MAGRSAREPQLLARPLLGGYESKIPPTAIHPTASPDLDNVMLSKGYVEKRGGFTPIIKEQPLLNSVRNKGFRAMARENDDAATTDNGEAIIVPGALYAGDRDIYHNRTEIAVDFFLTIDDLSVEHIGNADSTFPGSSPGPPYGAAPYDLKVRPILSKGPVKKSWDFVAAIVSTGLNWDTTAANQWGQGTDDGMPFCFYLWNNGSVSSPDWQFRLAFHTKTTSTGVWNLQVLTSSLGPSVGRSYHVQFGIGLSNGNPVGTLRIADYTPNTDNNYTEDDTGELTGEEYNTENDCPIQIFDCPQAFIEQSATGSTTVRPGLELTDFVEGGYFFAAKRFEGAVEDIAIWHQDPFSRGQSGALDRERKLDLERLPTTPSGMKLISYWSMTEPGEDLVEEMTGAGNHLYFSPRGPVTDQLSGGPRSGSWWFNGLTSYALCNLVDAGNGNPNWRYRKDSSLTDAAMMRVVRQNLPHGIHADFWVDSVEPNFEQVLVEIHGVLRLAITTDGQIRGWARDGDGGSTTNASAHGLIYGGTVDSTFSVKPGQRYSVTLIRHDSGTSLSLYVNGVLDNASGINASNNTANGGRPIGTMTFGMGAHQAMIQADTPNDTASLPNLDRISMDSRSGFIGRIESAMVLLGKTEDLLRHYKDQEDADWYLDQQRLWSRRAGIGAVLFPSRAFDPVWVDEVGFGAHIQHHRQAGIDLRTPVDLINVGNYEITDIRAPASEGGFDAVVERFRAKMWFVLGRFDFGFDDRDIDYQGAYLPGIEWFHDTFDTVTPSFPGAHSPDDERGVHIQLSQVGDRTGALATVERRCRESDILSDDKYNAATLYTAVEWTHALRPYFFRSPKELGPKWAEGIVQPLAGTNPITLVADWQDEVSGERFLTVGCGRQLYWAKPTWRWLESPFRSEQNAWALWFGGQGTEHVNILTTNPQQVLQGASPKTNLIEWEAWVYPHTLDQNRLIFSKGLNWALWTVEGAIHIAGTMDSGTRAWWFREAEDDGTSEVFETASIKAKQWNHIRVSLKASTVEVRVNGQLIPLSDMSALSLPKADGYNSGTSDIDATATLGGGVSTISFTTAAGFTPFYEVKSWAGYITEVRQTNNPATNPTVPINRYEDDSDTWILLHFNEGEAWAWNNDAETNAAGDDADSNIRELVKIKEGLEESRDAPYRWVVFRDKLFITNGLSRPQQIAFRSFSDPRGPFSVHNVGIVAPPPRTRMNAEVADDPGDATDAPAGEYQVQIAFIGEDGTESEPVLERVFNPVTVFDRVHINRIPRSPDPQVIGRRIYLSASGGGVPLHHSDLNDNETQEVELHMAASSFEGVFSSETGVKLPAPRGKLIGVGSSALIIANLTDIPAGQNAFSVSQQAEPTYFQSDLDIVIDSRDGHPILGINSTLGRLYLSKRDSVWSFALQPIPNLILRVAQANLRVVNGSNGVGGGDAVYDNAIIGAGSRGVHHFAGSTLSYVSRALEGDWRTEIDVSDDGLLRQRGLYHYADSQYWLSVLRAGQRWNDRIYVMHTAVGEMVPWTRMSVPPHASMQLVLAADNQEPFVLIGTTSGALLRYNPEVFIDYHDDSRQLGGATTLEGNASGGTTTSLTIASGQFDTILDGLRGATVELTYNTTGGSTATVTRTIERSQAQQIDWREPMPSDFSSHASFVIGGYSGYWTTPWLAPQSYGSGLKVEWVDIDFVPNVGNLDVSAKTALRSVPVDADWDETGIETKQQDMAAGYQMDPFKFTNVMDGRWYRLRFGSDGIRRPFGVVGLALRYQESGQRAVQGRR